MGIGSNLVEFDFEKWKIIQNVKTQSVVLCIEKVNDETFLTGQLVGYL